LGAPIGESGGVTVAWALAFSTSGAISDLVFLAENDLSVYPGHGVM